MEHDAEQRTDDRRPPAAFGQATERSYTTDRRVLFKALAALAASGYPAPPDEAMDLIHDFYVRAWPTVSAQYDASRASFDTYLFACFVRFARPRIARLTRLRATLVAPAELEAMAQAGGPVFADEAVEGADTVAVRAAFSALPRPGRDLLEAYLDDAEPSERTLAARFGMSRYAVRGALTDMLGLVATRLGAESGFAEPDRLIARALWADQRSPRHAAAYLGLSTETVQAARLRIFTRLVAAVRGSKIMSETAKIRPAAQRIDPAALVAAALAPGAGEQNIDAVKVHAESICRYLDTLEAEADVRAVTVASADRLAAFYDALAQTMDGEGSEPPAFAAPTGLLQARDADARRVGDAMDILLAEVPRAWQRFQDAFRNVEAVDEVHLAILLAGASLQEAGDRRREMARFGITPVTVVEATRSLSSTALDFCRERGIGRGGHLRLESGQPGKHYDDLPVLERRDAQEELRLDLELDSKAAAALYDWLYAIAGELPLLFDGFQTVPSRGTLRLTRTDTAELDLFKRWNPHWHFAASA